jgi:hypothetical protein
VPTRSKVLMVLGSLQHKNRGFEFRWRHGGMSAFFCVVLFRVGRGLATGRSHVQRVLPKWLKWFGFRSGLWIGTGRWTLEGGEWSASRPGRFTPGERASSTHWRGGWVGPRTGPDAVEERKIPSPRQESNLRTPTIVQPAAPKTSSWRSALVRTGTTSSF